MQHFPALPNKSEDTIVNAWQWAQYNSEECEQWPLGKLYSDFTFDLFNQEQYLYNKVTPSLLAPCPHVTDVLMCWLLRPFFKSSWLQSRKNNRKLDIWEPRWVSRDEFGLGLVVGFLEWSGLFTFYTCQDLMNMDIISPLSYSDSSDTMIPPGGHVTIIRAH